jgi:hypothetical protein
MSNDNAKGSPESNAGPKRSESDVYDRQIRLWGADAQARSPCDGEEQCAAVPSGSTQLGRLLGV